MIRRKVLDGLLKPKSISRRFSYAFVGVVALVCIVFAGVAIFVNIARTDSEIKSRLENTVNLAKISLATPLWNLDNEQVEHIFDAILLDVDNGPEGLTNDNNQWLYSADGLCAMYGSLKPESMLAIWSAGPDTQFVTRLKKVGFQVSLQTVRARPGKGSRHTIFLAQRPFRENLNRRMAFLP